MITSLWEWSIRRDANGSSAGISRTRHGAMQALAKTLIQAGRATARSSRSCWPIPCTTRRAICAASLLIRRSTTGGCCGGSSHALPASCF